MPNTLDAALATPRDGRVQAGAIAAARQDAESLDRARRHVCLPSRVRRRLDLPPNRCILPWSRGGSSSVLTTCRASRSGWPDSSRMADEPDRAAAHRQHSLRQAKERARGHRAQRSASPHPRRRARWCRRRVRRNASRLRGSARPSRPPMTARRSRVPSASVRRCRPDRPADRRTATSSSRDPPSAVSASMIATRADANDRGFHGMGGPADPAWSEVRPRLSAPGSDMPAASTKACAVDRPATPSPRTRTRRRARSRRGRPTLSFSRPQCTMATDRAQGGR